MDFSREELQACLPKREKKRRKVSHVGTNPAIELGFRDGEPNSTALRTSCEVYPVRPSLGMTRDAPQIETKDGE